MDLYGKDRGNISLPKSLQTADFDETKLKDVIVNTQKCFYDLKITEINNKIRRLEERNKELEDNLEDINYLIQILQEEQIQEISNLKSQIISYVTKIKDYNQQSITLEKARIDDRFIHTARALNIDEKYKDTRLLFTSQIKLLNAKINILEDYKSAQHILEKKLNLRSQFLIDEREQVVGNLSKIEWKFKIDRERFKKKLYNHLLDLANVFQLEVSKHVPRSIPNLLSENIALTNQLSMIRDNTGSKISDILRTYTIKEYKKKISDMHLNITRSIVTSKVEKSITTMLHNIYKKANITLSKLVKFKYLTEEQYITNKDYAKILARKCETRTKHAELLLYCEKEMFNVAKSQKRWISKQLQENLQMLYDVKYMLKNLEMGANNKNNEQ